MRIFIKSFLFTVFLLSPNIVIAEGCNDYTSSGSQICEQSSACKWENGTCTERCPINSGTNSCVNYDGCYTDADFGGCSPCDPNTYNNTSGATSCTSCSSFSYSNPGQIFDTAYANTYGLSTCPWMCDNGYYRGGTGFDECIQCTGSLHCSSTGLEYSNPVSNGIYCTGNTQIVYNDTTHTYSCESCSDSNASLDGTVCKCKEGYYGTLNGLNTTCTACPAGTTTGAAGATAKSACHMTQNTKFCDANGENCMKLLPAGITIN